MLYHLVRCDFSEEKEVHINVVLKQPRCPGKERKRERDERDRDRERQIERQTERQRQADRHT